MPGDLMARLRTLKPELYTNDDLAACSIAARYLFPGLWCYADRRGILEDRPLRIKANLFPFDNVDVDSLLSELHAQGFIRRYVVDGVHCISIPRFLKHQNPHVNEKANDLPNPPPYDQSVGELYLSSAGIVQVQDENSSSIAPICLRNGLRNGHGSESLSAVSDETAAGELTEDSESAPVKYTDDFEAFWKSYPRGRGNKRQSFAAWKKLRKVDRAQAIAALEDWLDCDLWQDITKVKYCERWLRDHCFADPPPNGVSRNGTGKGEAWHSVSDALAAEYADKLDAIEENAIASGEPFAILRRWLDAFDITEDQFDEVTRRLNGSKP